MGKLTKVAVALGAMSGALWLCSPNNTNATSLTDETKINPAYTQYLNDVKAGNGAKWKLIPSKYLSISSSYGGDKPYYGKGGNSLPSSYSLIESGYGTTIKNQGGDGDCWAYATTTAMESYMKKKASILNLRLNSWII